jgi:hypothetical protein
MYVLIMNVRAASLKKSPGQPLRLKYAPKRAIFLPPPAIAGIMKWLDVLSSDDIPWCPLFVKPDGFLDIFDGLTFPSP